MGTKTLREAILECGLSDVAIQDEGFQWVLCFPRDFVGFSGHFPDHPVLPAFVQILTAQCALHQRSGQSWTLQQVKRAKFMKIIEPDQTLIVTWQEKDLAEGLQCHFTLTVDDQKVASLIAVFRSQEEGHA